jgi:hypothetical protein
MVGGFSNDDFTPSICNMKRNNSSTTSDPMGLADVSSYILRQSENTFNPDNYDYILLPKDQETMSQPDVSVSAPSISEMSNRNKRLNFQSQAAMQEWMN